MSRKSNLVLNSDDELTGCIKISTICAREELLVAGGFAGEFVIKNTTTYAVHSGSITNDFNGITNQMQIDYASPSSGLHVIASSNDEKIRFIDLNTLRKVRDLSFPVPVNVCMSYCV